MRTSDLPRNLRLSYLPRHRMNAQYDTTGATRRRGTCHMERMGLRGNTVYGVYGPFRSMPASCEPHAHRRELGMTAAAVRILKARPRPGTCFMRTLEAANMRCASRGRSLRSAASTRPRTCRAISTMSPCAAAPSYNSTVAKAATISAASFPMASVVSGDNTTAKACRISSALSVSWSTPLHPERASRDRSATHQGYPVFHDDVAHLDPDARDHINPFSYPGQFLFTPRSRSLPCIWQVLRSALRRSCRIGCSFGVLIGEREIFRAQIPWPLRPRIGRARKAAPGTTQEYRT
jgi:hypothetical protein